MPYHALTLPADVPARLTAGVRDLPFDLVRDAQKLEPGQPLRLLSPSGTLLALAAADPENELIRVFAIADEGMSALDSSFFRARVKRALALRRTFGLSREGGAHRLVNMAGDGLPGMAVDLYGDYAVLYVYSRGLITLGRLLADAVMAVAGVAGVVLKVRTRDAAQQQIRQEVLGQSPPDRMVVHEGGVPYEAHLLGGLNVGLFTDMREHRERLARFVNGRTVLNGFSYTASLSVAAARAGAAAVTSVDLSSGVQRWAMENFRLSNLPVERHRFEVDDVAAYLKKAARRGDRYDVILLDPPTYSAARASAWSMRKDYPDLIVRACALLPAGGLLWLSANARELEPLPTLAQGAFSLARRSAQLLEIGGLPPDYPTLPAHPTDRYLQLCLFCVQ
jgi:23S rRNA (cytosine1962-C5)-methyltransferase